MSPQCDLRAADMKQIVVNYEALTDEEKEAVPDTAFKAAKEYLVIQDRLREEKAQPPRMANPASASAAVEPSRGLRPTPPSILRHSGDKPSTIPESKNS